MDKPESVFWSHYIDEKIPQYPFGHGLNTRFEYSNLQLSSQSFGLGGKLLVSVTVKNVGKVIGKEVVQMYIRI
jgi:beta-glucosidase